MEGLPYLEKWWNELQQKAFESKTHKKLRNLIKTRQKK